MSRPQRPCRQPHGTVARYAAGCSCLKCCEAWNVWNRDHRAGRIKDVPPDAARDHIKYLRARGWSVRAIATQAVVGYTTVWAIVRGERQHIRPSISNAICALTDTAVVGGPNVLIPARPTLKLIQRLRRQHSRVEIARACGVSPHSLPRHGQRSVRVVTAQRVEAAAERLRSA